MNKRSGFVGIIGRPNVGKSTLLNHLIGEKIAGVSERPQTTRDIIRGILTRPEGQAIYLDTPGLHQPKDKLGGWMVRAVEGVIKDLDVIYMMALPRMPEAFERQIIQLFEDGKRPVFLLINQIDCYKKHEILPVLDAYQKMYNFDQFIPISAKTGEQMDVLLEETFKALPEGEYLFPEDQISDQNERFLVCELIREKVYHMTKKEVPYSAVVVINQFEQKEDKIVHIDATVYVEREGQKAIMIGKNGENMKIMGTEARKDIEALLGQKVFLKLWVKVERDWKDDRRMLKRFGYA